MICLAAATRYCGAGVRTSPPAALRPRARALAGPAPSWSTRVRPGVCHRPGVHDPGCNYFAPFRRRASQLAASWRRLGRLARGKAGRWQGASEKFLRRLTGPVGPYEVAYVLLHGVW